MKDLTKTAALIQRTHTQNNEFQPQRAPWWPNLPLSAQMQRFTSTENTFTQIHQDLSWIYTFIFSFFGHGFLWLYSTQMSPTRPLGYSVHAGPASAHGEHQSCAEGLLFILYLLIITRLPSADHQSFIPHILTCASRVFVALAAAQQIKFGVTCSFCPDVFHVFHLIFNEPYIFYNQLQQ